MNTNKLNHNHLAMCYGGSKIREPVSKHMILGWLVKLIKAAYKADGRIVLEVTKDTFHKDSGHLYRSMYGSAPRRDYASRGLKV